MPVIIVTLISLIVLYAGIAFMLLGLKRALFGVKYKKAKNKLTKPSPQPTNPYSAVTSAAVEALNYMGPMAKVVGDRLPYSLSRLELDVDLPAKCTVSDLVHMYASSHNDDAHFIIIHTYLSRISDNLGSCDQIMYTGAIIQSINIGVKNVKR